MNTIRWESVDQIKVGMGKLASEQVLQKTPGQKNKADLRIKNLIRRLDQQDRRVLKKILTENTPQFKPGQVERLSDHLKTLDKNDVDKAPNQQKFLRHALGNLFRNRICSKIIIFAAQKVNPKEIEEINQRLLRSELSKTSPKKRKPESKKSETRVELRAELSETSSKKRKPEGKKSEIHVDLPKPVEQGPGPLIITRNKIIAYSELTILRDISSQMGKGSDKAIFEVRWKDQSLALKKYSFKTLPSYLYHKFDSLCSAEHENILQFMGVCIENGNFGIVTELCPLNLWSLEKKYEEGTLVNSLLKNRIASGIARGLSYLHDQLHIAHLALKISNVFLTSDFVVKIGGFGLDGIKVHAEGSSSPDGVRSHGGIDHYAPERLQKERVKSLAAIKCTDIFSLGMLLWRLEARKEPYFGLTESEKLGRILRGELPEIDYSWEYALIIKNCFNLNPALRPTAAEVLKSLGQLDEKKILLLEWMKQVNESHLGFKDVFIQIIQFMSQINHKA